MGKLKDLMIEHQEQATQRILAQELGISYDELCMLDYEIDGDIGTDGQLYHYIIKFSPDSSKDILNKIPNIESGNTVYLAPWQLNRQYDFEAQFSAITEKKNNYRKFTTDIENIKQLNNLTLGNVELEQILKRQIFISIIGLMETFLSDTFIQLTTQNPTYFRNFIETHPEFKQRKFELREIYTETEKLKDYAEKVMLETIYHNLPSIQQMYIDTFKIDFPKINKVYPHVIERHDLVHRNGNTKDGKKVITDKTKIEDLIQTVNEFVVEIAYKLNIK